MTDHALHVRATILPYGKLPTDVWIAGGRVTFEPQPGARPLAPTDGFVAAGLVDAHTHIHFVGDPTARQGRAVIDENRRRHLEAGTLLLRDMGTTSDEVLGLPEDDGLPIVQAAGQSLLVEPRYPFFVTAARELPGAIGAQARAGARWVKIFADWPGWPGKQEEPNFGPDDRLTYPKETLAEAVEAAHASGARVAVHAFGREGAAAAVDVRVDSIEHGWGLDEALLERMAALRIAWIPMLGIAEPMLQSAESPRTPEPKQARWIRDTLARMPSLLRAAQRLGVPILAGTDWFPYRTLADELSLLHEYGLDAEAAVATATTAARRFLGVPDLEEGAPADLVLFRSDPRRDLRAITSPDAIVLRGRVIRAPVA